MTKLSCGPLWKENNKWDAMVLCMIFAHGFGRDGFRSMVLDASACINMYCNIERNIMKNQAGSPGFGIQGKISVHMCFMCSALALFIFFV